MLHKTFTRRNFIKTSAALTLGAATGWSITNEKPVVSVVKIKNGKIDYAVEKAIDLLGGIKQVAKNKNSIMLKPNLVAEYPTMTTKPAVIRTLAKMMQDAGKEVLIGEGSATANGYNLKGDVTFRTKRTDILNPMQQYVFDKLGYTDLAKSMGIPLINLHSGEMAEVDVPGGLLYDKITLHKSLTDIDMLCSVPMMKTHVLATVTLGMKNLIGVYPGTVYYSVRSFLHDRASEKGSPGVAFEILDMVRANKLGLNVIDGSIAMEGNGPSMGSLVKMDLIIAGTNPLATDMVAAKIMGIDSHEVPTFTWAIKTGMRPADVNGVEIRGEQIENVQRRFVRPNLLRWTDIHKSWGVRDI